MRSHSRILALPALALLLPALVLADAPDPLADARQQVQKLRVNDPQHYARLRHNLAVFLNLPPARQEALRKLDRDLHDETPPQRQRLERVMDRYADWLERLPEAERKSVLSAADRAGRVQRIRTIREQQWTKRLPKAKAEQLAKMPEAERAELVKKWRSEESEERLDWLAAQRHWEGLARTPASLPTRLEQLDEATREAVEKTLRPLLGRDEEKLLKEAEGKWPRFPRVLIELSDRHPSSLQGPIGPTSVKDLALSPFAQGLLDKDKNFRASRERLKEAEGKWPDYGVTVKELHRMPAGRKIFPPLSAQVTPSRPNNFPAGVQQFLEKRLLPALDDDETARLKKAEGRWPDYPQAILELAHKHNLPIPSPPRLESLERYRTRYLTNAAPRRGEPFWLVP